MASIFTFDPDPPSVSSPWLSLDNVQTADLSGESLRGLQTPKSSLPLGASPASQVAPATRLEAEPQEGPTEYKLHLLLRPRRSLSSTSTGKHVAGSQHSKSPSSTPRSVSEAALSSSLSGSPPAASSNSSRQHRLEQLTTQLLWRLQQSSPYHSNSANNLILPSLPEAKPELQPPERPAKLLPGLEESRGALYEIGVSDDGTLVGLTMDEMNESLNNLRAMAGSLGCSVKILRMVCVGDCEWLEIVMDDSAEDDDDGAKSVLRSGNLFVAEAYVKPELRSARDSLNESRPDRRPDSMLDAKRHGSLLRKSTVLPPERVEEQLRVTLTGATTCGKSSLLGTLSTSTLDNSRGKSRLSLLKHRHEIASGITSSVSQELVGYHDDESNGRTCTNVVNYATENVSSWTDIHGAAESGRLASLSDSAGHPRYRRTTVRGLVGCAPHWVFVCIAANEDPDTSGQNHSASPEDSEYTFAGANAHISIAHLDLCLKLQVPLAIIITKFDLATKSGFRLVLSTLLTRLKDAGRKPEILSSDNVVVTENDLQTVPSGVSAEVSRITGRLAQRPLEIVPMIFTSAVKGSGIAKLHALLRHLPLPSVEQAEGDRTHTQLAQPQETPKTLFHIDDLFNLPIEKIHASDGSSPAPPSAGSVVSGHLATGTISVGDELRLGPFSDAAAHTSGSEDISAEGSSSELADGFLAPRSFTDALVKATSSPKLKATPAAREWRRVAVVSVRNLRMPVHSLRTDQVGTIGIQPLADDDGTHNGSAPGPLHGSSSSVNRRRPLQIRKGMVLLASSGPASSAHTFTASFHVGEAASIIVGTMVVVYSASVRASAKVVAVALETTTTTSRTRHPSDNGGGNETSTGNRWPALESDDYAFGFDFDDDGDQDRGDEEEDEVAQRSGRREGESESVESILVTFRLVTYREWLGTGARVLVMPGGGPGLHGGTERGVKGVGGLEGFVGRVVQTFG